MSKTFSFLAFVGLFMCCIACGTDSDSAIQYETEVVSTPTQGVVTTVKEVREGEFKIEDEEAVPTPDDSRIIAKWSDSTVDTFTLDEARLEEESGRRGGFMTAASYGLMGYMMGRSMGGFRPSSGAYVDQKTYNKVSNGAGARMQQTAKRTTISKPKSGFGGKSSSSSRSYGG